MTTQPAGITALDQIDQRTKLTGHQKSVIWLAIIANVSEFFDMFLIGFAVSLLTKPWQLTGFETGTILACSGLGTVIGAIVWGRLADRYGRKHAFTWCILMFVVFTAACVVTPDRGWILLAVLRILVGAGVGGLNITSIPYVQEFVPAKHRGFLSGLASVFIPAGLFLGALAQRFLGDLIGWRGLIALGVIPIFLLFWLKLVPESPRFLQTQGRTKEAREALAWALEIDEKDLAPLPPLSAETKPQAYSVIFKRYPRALAVVTLGSFCFILGSFTVQSWGQTLLKDAYGFDAAFVGTLFMIVSLGDLLGRLGSAWLADKIGRRYTMLSFGILGGIGAIIAALATSGDSGWLFFVGILIVMTFGDGAFGILNAFGSEQFPNEARSSGLGLGYGIGAAAKVVGPALMGAMIGGGYVAQNVSLDAVRPAFLLFAVLLFVGGIIYLFARETKGESLEQI
ncbi:MFS transporter [Nanchangia anserum]|uniref:MFS transporter n=1 Tax=Nanchangia anserum TaxID=2692125 RepID=A0A8I0KQ80_9ACTO|nr:MFS transporter [Nanchangia anserum]MBD3689690.1 MFS transporter [Nanchangia anserum]QOX81867.1 MFS transporter [Nanchangia anserum]